MRRLKSKVFKYVIAAVLCVSIVGGKQIYDNQQLKNYVFIDEVPETVPLAPGIDSNAQSALEETLAMLPPRIYEKFVSDGWQMVLTDENLADKYFKGKYSAVMAVTDSSIKTIWIDNTERSVRNSVIHELGHYIDYSMGFADSKSDFQSIYEAEKRLFVVVGGSGAQARSSSIEYFAEALQETVLHPESCMSHTPRTYAYMVSLLALYQ